MKERMKWLSSSQNSPDFGFTPLSLSTMNLHSITHMQSVEEIICSTVHDLHSLFQTPSFLWNRNDLSIKSATHYNPILYSCVPFTCRMSAPFSFKCI